MEKHVKITLTTPSLRVCSSQPLSRLSTRRGWLLFRK